MEIPDQVLVGKWNLYWDSENFTTQGDNLLAHERSVVEQIINITKDNNGEYKGFLCYKGDKLPDEPNTKVSINGNDVTFEVTFIPEKPELGLKFRGIMADSDNIHGSYSMKTSARGDQLERIGEINDIFTDGWFRLIPPGEGRPYLECTGSFRAVRTKE